MFNIQIDTPKAKAGFNSFTVIARPQNASLSKKAQNSVSYLDQMKMNSGPTIKTCRKMSLSSTNRLKISTVQNYQNYQNQHKRVVMTQDTDISRVNIQQISAIVQILSRQIQKQNHQIKTIENQINSDFLVQRTLSSFKKSELLQQVLNCNSNIHNSAFNQVYDHLFNIKLEMQSIKQQISKSKKKNCIDFQYMTGSDRIRQQLKIHKTEVQKIVQELKQSIPTISLSHQLIDTSIKRLKKLDIDVKSIKQKLDMQICNPFLKVSDQVSIFPGNSYKYQQILKMQSGTQIKLTQSLYYVDKEGYLLDSHNHYIINQVEQRVKVDARHLQKLKEHGILVNRQFEA